MKLNIDRDLKADIWNFLEELQKHTPQEVYESQEFYLDVLRLLFNNQFRQKIKTLREQLEVPLNWYNYPQSKETHYRDLFDLKEKHSDAPQREFDEVIVDLCSLFGLNPLRYGWFVLYYLYYANLSLGIERSASLIASEEFRRKARIIVKRNNNSSKDKSFEKHRQVVGYIQLFKDTTPDGLTEFIKDNMQTITKLQKVLASYPVERVRSIKTFKRDIEIFLLDKLDFSDSKITNIMQNTPTLEEQRLMAKSFDELTNGEITLSQRNYPTSNRKEEDIYQISEETVRNTISSIKQEIMEA